jgi:hypothetical protein
MATQRPGFTGAGTDLDTKRDATTPGYEEEKAIDEKIPSAITTPVGDAEPQFDATQEDHFGEAAILTDAKDVLTHVIHVDDDPTLSPWTLRAWFLGELHHCLHF